MQRPDTSWLCLAVTAAALTARLAAAEPVAPVAEPAASAAGRVELQLADDRVVRGDVVVEADDGGLLLEHDDGRYELVQPDHIRRRAPAPEPEPESPQDLGRRLLAELPAGFDLLVTKHYIFCFATSRDYARWCAPCSNGCTTPSRTTGPGRASS